MPRPRRRPTELEIAAESPLDPEPVRDERQSSSDAEPLRDERGRWLRGTSGFPVRLRQSPRMTRTAAEAFRRVDAAGWLAGLPPEHRRMVEERALELTRGRLQDLTPARAPRA